MIFALETGKITVFSENLVFLPWEAKVLHDLKMLQMSRYLNLKALKAFQKHFWVSKKLASSIVYKIISGQYKKIDKVRYRTNILYQFNNIQTSTKMSFISKKPDSWWMLSLE